MAMKISKRCETCGSQLYYNEFGDFCCINCGIVDLDGKSKENWGAGDMPSYVG